MSGRDFKVKTILCDVDKVLETVSSAETTWLESMLLKSRVPKVMLRKKQRDEVGNSQWRDYLFNQFRLNIFKNLSTKKVGVYRYDDSDEKNIQIGEWSPPEVIRIKTGSKSHYELRLKYWQII
jgi:hypothetical protein